MKKLIGVTCFFNSGQKGKNEIPYYRLNRDYIEAVEAAGGLPVVIPVLEPGGIADEYIARVDGLFVTGGKGSCVTGDISEVPGKPRELRAYDPPRYDFEVQLLQSAMRKGIPVLGICRGMQMICEVTGGKIGPGFLDEGARETCGVEHRQAEPGNIPTHAVSLQQGTLLHSIIGKEQLMVNSFHHQECTQAGEGFVVSARAPGGVTEAIEKPDYNFLLGIQFHPEKMYRDSIEFKKIFDSFVAACGDG